MRTAMRVAALAVAVTAAPPLAATARAHQTVTDRGVAVTLHVLPGDEPQAGRPATIVVVSVRPRSGSFAFAGCACRIKVTAASGRVLLDRRTGKRTPFTFPDAAAYEIAYSGRYRAQGGGTKRFSTTFAIRAS